MLYGFDTRSPLKDQENIDLDLIHAQLTARIQIITATDDDNAIFKLMSISKVLSEGLRLAHGRTALPQETFKRTLQSEVDLSSDLAELVASRYKNWEALATAVDDMALTRGPGHEELCRLLIIEHKSKYPRTWWLNENDIKHSVIQLYKYVADASTVWHS
ncbi:hypothetical protein PM082_013319 [Marasmius tenuissimus]|nr:hypothetical protein PM082_013319 [Marasmius tenuissimus]